MSRSTAHRGRLRTAFAPAVALITAGMLLLSGAGAAQAAPPYASEGHIDTLKFRKDKVESGLLTQLQATWSFDDRPSAPAGFTIDLHPDLQGREEKFTLTAEDDASVKVADCEVTTTQLICDLDPDYIRENPRDLKGNVYFWVRVTTEVAEEQEVTYSMDQDVTVTVTPPNPWVCTVDCDLNWSYQKDGWLNYDTNRLVWYAHVEAPRGGMEPGLNVSVKDTPDENQQLVVDDEFNPQLQRSNELGRGEDNVERPVNWEIVPRDEYEVDPADGTVSFVTEAGYYYQVRFMTERLVDTDTYSNHVDFTVNGVLDGGADTETVVQQGGGTGIGTDLGTFSIEKAVTGAPNLPADTVYSGTYTVTPPSGGTIEGTWETTAGETFTSEEFPRNSTVALTENAPSGPSNITWGDPVFSSNDFVLTGGQNTPVTVTNTAAVKLGQFTAKKVLDGTAEAIGMVPGSRAYHVEYSYPAGVGFEAGGGAFELTADGTPYVSPSLPVGAVLTIGEVEPADRDGVRYGQAVITPAELTITEGAATELVVTNPVVVDTPPTSTPTPTPTPTKSELSVTGAGMDLGGSLLLVGLLVAAGATAIAAARTRRAVRD